MCVSRTQVCYFPTGGLRPSLLCLVYLQTGCRSWCARGHHRTFTCFVSHGGLTPPAPGAVNGCSFTGEITPFAMQKRTFTRAAGVSPRGVALVRCRKVAEIAVPHWCIRGSARGADAERYSRRNNAFCVRNARKRLHQVRCRKVLPSLCPRTLVHSRAANPRGAYAPRSWRLDGCSFTGEITPFAMQKRTFTRAAGVSPPWV
jgi:hypothetical protein